MIDNNDLDILNLTRKLTRLMIEKDIVEMSKILDAHFTLTHITGFVQPREEWLKEIESEQMKYFSYQEIKTSIEIAGDKATFIGQNLLDAKIWGARNNWRLQQTIYLEKRIEKWIIIKSVATIF
ncbi:nuclear transport factor 2 family protein [Pedobacter frigidisoli]|uniref:Nuclear transport factor 2 family protein n=1 Tax=Pedobacter frigidisoli TaxID=2530455 RepID=A0A4R0P596_9SPHI|nr:nuclear transport factor 2 family protein [Pedobacter frigidisoli]TCD12043.1 nuclear transport factor 2 family protein [Pedobacter frigidisoli]